LKKVLKKRAQTGFRERLPVVVYSMNKWHEWQRAKLFPGVRVVNACSFSSLHRCPESDRNFNQNHPIVNQIRGGNARSSGKHQRDKDLPDPFFRNQLSPI
jgi:hypothetical protein